MLKGSVKARGSKPASTANEKCILTNATMRNDHRRRREVTDVSFGTSVSLRSSFLLEFEEFSRVLYIPVLVVVVVCVFNVCVLIVR